MWVHVAAIAGAAAGCAAWGLFQLWMRRANPDCELRAGCCGGKHCKKSPEFTPPAG